MQSVRESSHAGVIVKCSFEHTSLLLYRDLYELHINSQQASSTTHVILMMKQINVDGRKMHVLDYST